MSPKPNRWKGFTLGMLGGVAGLYAMDSYWRKVAPSLEAVFGYQERGAEGSLEPQPPDDISIFGRQYRDEESSTATLDRLLYIRITGKEPESQEAKIMLSYLVHWSYGVLQGGVYGAATALATQFLRRIL